MMIPIDVIKDVKIGRKIRRKIFSRLYVDRGNGTQHTIFIAGSGRSGTTWLSDIVNYQNECRYIFEPFRPDRVKVCRHFKNRQYIRPDNRDEDYLRAAGIILSGKVRDQWANSLNTKFMASKRIIKAIRANLLLKWLHTNFPEIPIVFLMRHPFATAFSMSRLGWPSIQEIDSLFTQTALYEDYLHPFKKLVSQAQSEFERWLLIWCIENYVPLKQFSPGELYPVFYEALCANPFDEIHRLFAYLGKPLDEDIFQVVDVPSATCRLGSAIISGKDRIGSWRHHLTDEQIESGMAILQAFGFDRIYADDLMPRTNDPFL